MNHSIHSWDPNTTTSPPRHYVSLPIDDYIKVLLSVIYGMVGVLAVVANALILYLKRKQRSQRKRQAQRAFNRTETTNTFIQSLAWSGLLCGMINFPVSIISFSVDILQYHWVCKTARYFHALSPIIKLISFFVIGIERYFVVFYPFAVPSKRTVRKLVASAWFIGCLITLFIAAMFSSVTYNLSHDRYTVICVVDSTSQFNRVGLIFFSLVLYVIPIIVLTVINIRIFKALRKREKSSNTSQVQKRRFKVTNMFVMLIFSFIIPYSACVFYSSLRPVYKPYLSYSTDKMLRHLCGLMAFSNAAIGPIVIIYSMPDLKMMIKGKTTTRVFPAARSNVAVIYDANPSRCDQIKISMANLNQEMPEENTSEN